MAIKAGPSPEKKQAADKKIPVKRTLKSVAKTISKEDRSASAKNLNQKLPKSLKTSTKKWTKLDWTKRKSNAWAKPVMTDNVLRQLELCFMVGMNDLEACVFCEIWSSTLYDYQKSHPEFLERKALWKNKITLQAKINIWRSIKDWEVSDSKWWLERKARKEFGNRVGLVDDSDLKFEEDESDVEMYELILSRKNKK